MGEDCLGVKLKVLLEQCSVNVASMQHL